MKTLMAVLSISLALSLSAKAQTFDIDLSGNGYTMTGTITSTASVGGGVYSALSGSVVVNGITLSLDPVAPGQTEIVLQNMNGTGGANFSGDDLFGANYVSGDGLVFSTPEVTASDMGFVGDAVNLWGNGGGSYTLAAFGTDFGSSDLYGTGVSGSITATPEPSSWALGLIALGGFAGLIRVRRRAKA